MEKGRIQVSLVWATYNGVEEGEEVLTKEMILDFFKQKGCSWVLMGREIAPETGMVHIHVLAKLKERLRISAKKFALEWDIEKKNGEVWHPHVEAKQTGIKVIKDLIKYICVEDGCDKEPLSWNIDWKGYLEKDKKRQRCFGIDDIREKGFKKCVEEGLIPLNQVKATMQGYQLIELMNEPLYTKRTKGLWLWGDAGMGKSTFVKELAQVYGNGKMYRKGASRWWDGYSGEEVVVMDDPGQRSMSMILDRVKCWADQSPAIVETKGGMMWARHKWLVVTTNWNPQEMCNQETLENELTVDSNGYDRTRAVKKIVFDKEGWEAIQRRFRILYIGKHENIDFIRFSPDMFPDNEWCEYRDLIEEFDSKTCWKEFIEKFPDITKKPDQIIFNAWCSFATLWNKKHLSSSSVKKPAKKRTPKCDIVSLVQGSGYE